jgi:hypothetical protein
MSNHKRRHMIGALAGFDRHAHQRQAVVLNGPLPIAGKMIDKPRELRMLAEAQAGQAAEGRTFAELTRKLMSADTDVST